VLLRGPKQKSKQLNEVTLQIPQKNKHLFVKVLFSNFPRIFFISLRCMKITDLALLHAFP
jgi:hypothetical protein